MDFKQLGILRPGTTLIDLSHDQIESIDGADNFPGDRVLIKAKNTIIFSVCNVYFEARRELDQPRRRMEHQ